MSSKKKKTKQERLKKIKGYSEIDIMANVYIAFMLGIFPWIMHDRYFDITITRARFAMYSGIVCLLIGVILMVIKLAVDAYFEDDSIVSVKHTVKDRIMNPLFWIAGFGICNVFAALVAPDIKIAFTGENGRYMGLEMMLILVMVCIFLGMGVKLCEYNFVVFALVVIYAFVVAFEQHIGNDFMGYKEGISHKQYNIFISTLGNINIYASFVVIAVLTFAALYVFGNRFFKVVSAVMVTLGGTQLIVSNSDSVFLGIGAGVLVLGFVCYYRGCLLRLVEMLGALMTGNLITVLRHELSNVSYDKREGFARAIDRLDIAVGLVLGIVCIWILMKVFSKEKRSFFEKLNKKKVIIIMLILMGVCGVAFVIYGVTTGMEIFRFNYKWGTYRGYIWTKCTELFKAAPLKNKLFGYGNETIKTLMSTNFYDEMINVTGKVYDNAHNELLQYLVTTGIFGVLFYIGSFITSFIYILKGAAKAPIAYVCLVVMTGYFAQGLINLNQPITTPLYFVFMGLGIGIVRRQHQIEEIERLEG